jgi:hypothetical protein
VRSMIGMKKESERSIPVWEDSRNEVRIFN